MSTPKPLAETPLELLVIEDDLVDEIALTRAMQHRPTPYRLTVARSVAEARKTLEEKRFDVILADNQLGDGTSFELMDAFAGQLVIFVAGAGDEDMAVRAMQQGAHDFLLKDVDHAYLKLLPWRVETALTHVQQSRALSTLVTEKTALVREVHHRVKNNLQVITSLLRLEASRGTQVDAKTVLNGMQARIRAIGLLHESLYRGNAIGQVDLGTYLRHLSEQAFQAQSTNDKVHLDLDLDSVSVTLDQATPAGLLLNELIANCLKHAFPKGRKGTIWVTLHPTTQQQWCLQVRDNGVGLPMDFATRSTESLGLLLVSDLAAQMQGTLAIEPATFNAAGTEGAVFRVVFTGKNDPQTL